MDRRRRLVVLCAWMLAACPGAGPGAGETTSGDSGSTGGVEPTSDDPGTTTDATTGNTGNTTTGTGGTTDACAEQTTDTTGEPPPCDVYTEDGCGPDEKCRPYQVDPTCLGFCERSFRCMPLADDPGAEGEQCTGNYEQTDTCDRRLFCNDGVCVPMCGGCAGAATCAHPNASCWGDEMPVCYVHCDPLAADCPEWASLCVLSMGFTCETPGGAVIDELYAPCEWPDQCASGMLCQQSPACGDGDCCIAVCDIFKPGSCPGPDEVCTNVFGNEPQYMHRGLCLPP